MELDRLEGERRDSKVRRDTYVYVESVNIYLTARKMGEIREISTAH